MVRYSKKRYGRKKRSVAWYNRKYTPWQVAQKALTGVRYLKGLVNSEMYHLDTSFTAANIVDSGNVTHLTALPQGDTNITRTGNSVLLKSLYFKLLFKLNTAVVYNSRIRMIIFFDKQQISDSSPAVTDVLASASTESLLNLNTAGRFKILYSKEYVINQVSSNGFATSKYFKLHTHTRFNGANSTDVQKNGLYVLFIGSEATYYPTVTGTFRIGYHDN